MTAHAALEVGDVGETVNVTAESPMLETATASVGRVVDRRTNAEMPQTDGNSYYVVFLAPGIVNLQQPGILISPGSQTGLAGSLVVDGAPAGVTEFTMNGMPNMAKGGVAFTPPADIVEEMNVETANYDSTIGYSPSGKVNTVIKSGSNALHGTLFEYNTSGPMYSTDFFTNKVIYNPASGPVTDAKKKFYHPNPIINRFGGTVSGPVFLPKIYDGRNRTFFSVGAQAFIRRSSSPGYQSVPRPEWLVAIRFRVCTSGRVARPLASAT